MLAEGGSGVLSQRPSPLVSGGALHPLAGAFPSDISTFSHCVHPRRCTRSEQSSVPCGTSFVARSSSLRDSALRVMVTTAGPPSAITRRNHVALIAPGAGTACPWSVSHSVAARRSSPLSSTPSGNTSAWQRTAPLTRRLRPVGRTTTVPAFSCWSWQRDASTPSRPAPKPATRNRTRHSGTPGSSSTSVSESSASGTCRGRHLASWPVRVVVDVCEQVQPPPVLLKGARGRTARHLVPSAHRRAEEEVEIVPLVLRCRSSEAAQSRESVLRHLRSRRRRARYEVPRLRGDPRPRIGVEVLGHVACDPRRDIGLEADLGVLLTCHEGTVRTPGDVSNGRPAVAPLPDRCLAPRPWSLR